VRLFREEVATTGARSQAEPVLTPWADRNQRFRLAKGLQLTVFESAEG
jgi:hypothetical protein